jgi:hypothetical protein
VIALPFAGPRAGQHPAPLGAMCPNAPHLGELNLRQKSRKRSRQEFGLEALGTGPTHMNFPHVALTVQCALVDRGKNIARIWASDGNCPLYPPRLGCLDFQTALPSVEGH